MSEIKITVAGANVATLEKFGSTLGYVHHKDQNLSTLVQKVKKKTKEGKHIISFTMILRTILSTFEAKRNVAQACRGTHIFLLVFDVDSVDQFRALEEKFIPFFADFVDLASYSILIVGTNIDKRKKLSLQCITPKEGEVMANRLSATYTECKISSRNKVNKLLDTIITIFKKSNTESNNTRPSHPSVPPLPLFLSTSSFSSSSSSSSPSSPVYSRPMSPNIPSSSSSSSPSNSPTRIRYHSAPSISCPIPSLSPSPSPLSPLSHSPPVPSFDIFSPSPPPSPRKKEQEEEKVKTSRPILDVTVPYMPFNPPLPVSPSSSSSSSVSPRSDSRSPHVLKLKDFGEAEIELLSLLGKGTVGETWKGKLYRLNKPEKCIAITKIPISSTSDYDKQKIYSDIDKCVKLKNEYIAKVYGRFSTKDQLYIIMELVEGGDLSFLLLSRDQIDVNTKIKYILQATKAVKFIHNCNPPLLHQKLKAANFLISTSGDLKLSGLGLGHIRSNFSNSTLNYRWESPETMAVDPQYNQKSDIYSIGMVFYEIMARSLPFQEISDNSQVMYLVKQQRMRPTIPPDCPQPLARLIQQCWDHDPDKRPNSSFLLDIVQNIFSSKLNLPVDPSSPRSSLFYEINTEVLLKTVLPEEIHVLSRPPSFPYINPPIPIPEKVLVVKIKNKSTNPLVSKTYSAQLFDQVEVYFRRFFVPSDMSLKVTLDEIHVILNPEVEKRFAQAEEEMHRTLNGRDELQDKSNSSLHQHYLNKLLTSPNLVSDRNSNAISAWHGANSRNFESICWCGMLNLSNTDQGYYGKGIYCTQYPKYGEYYARVCKEKTEGKFQLLLCWVLLGKPRSITKVQIGSPCAPGHTSHYTLVTKKNSLPSLCNSAQDYKQIAGMSSYFPVTEGERIEGDEITIFDGAHILPRFVVHYSIHQDNNIV